MNSIGFCGILSGLLGFLVAIIGAIVNDEKHGKRQRVGYIIMLIGGFMIIVGACIFITAVAAIY